MRHPKSNFGDFATEKRPDCLVAVGQKHGLGEESAILGHTYAHSDDGFGNVNDFIHAQWYLGYHNLPLQLLIDFVSHEADADVCLDSSRIKVEHRSHLQCAF